MKPIRSQLLIPLALSGLMSLPGEACELASPDSLQYSLREDNRCEGIQTQIDVSGALDLISLTSTTGGSLGDNLRIRVPRQDNNPPSFAMEELDSRYRVDSVPFIDRGNFYIYNLLTQSLSDAGVDSIDDLRAIAVTGTQRVYLPTFLGTPSDSYRFVFYSVDSVRFVEAGIRNAQGDDYQEWRAQAARRGEKTFDWDNAQNAPAGRYEFYYVAEIEQGNRAPDRISRSIDFWHDPSWLR